MLDVGLPGVQLVDFFLVGVETGDALAHVRKAQCQGQAHVAAPDNSDLDIFSAEKFRLALRGHLSPSLLRIKAAAPRPG